jgi:Flp pilus assembly protein TadG
MRPDILRDRRGVSIIEFAIGLPMFLIAVLGGLEVANLTLTQQRVAAVASQVAQNAARGTQQIDEADINQIFTGAELAASGAPILEKGRIILSSVRLNAAGNGQWIDWQRCTGTDKTVKSVYGPEGKGKADTSLQQVGPAPGIKAVGNVNIMVVEIRSAYQPIIGTAYAAVGGGQIMKSVTAQVVRERTTMGIKNDGALPATKIKTC